MKISVVLPAYNEGRGLSRIVGAIADHITGLGYEPEVIVIDDGSTDETWTVLIALHEQGQISQAVRFSRNFGKEAALAAGLDRVSGEAVIILDADFQHPPALIRHMLEIWRSERVDVVEAIKSQRAQPSLFRKIGANVFYMAFALGVHAPVEEMTDFKLLDKKVVAAWRRLGETHLFFRGLTAWLGFTHRKIFFEVPNTVSRRSRWPAWKLTSYAVNAITAFTTLPLLFAALAGGLLAVPTAFLLIRACYRSLINAPPDDTSLVLMAVFLVGSLILFCLGIIGLYLSQMYFEIKKRPRYVVADQR